MLLAAIYAKLEIIDLLWIIILVLDKRDVVIEIINYREILSILSDKFDFKSVNIFSSIKWV